MMIAKLLIAVKSIKNIRVTGGKKKALRIPRLKII
jgi:hypothetical protein